MKETVRWRPLDECKKNAAREELKAFHRELLELYGENYPYHSEFARILNEVARGKYTAEEAVRLSKRAA